MTFRIRTAKLKDTEFLARLHTEIFPEDAWTREWFAEKIRQKGARILVAELQGAPVGLAVISHVLDEAEILTIGLLPELRGQRYGQLLLKAVLEQPGCHFFLEVAEDNAAAIGLYKSAGFIESGRRSAYYRGGTDALVMVKSVPAL
ncbi:ribosomal protein S18-alanine N-acetyltransferase [Parvularcula sp. IMCC14364]|uniref:ribosomal protein S18-alanine N-acetyltransferase n=1 Tax=Parvularcula sp. IMCC14364 TaxID=3067902 RepID=UPI0027429574|nr:ribosomal protein S18-alanine N-acetyltransferase [Parvularcula sp. IMCC14364]